MTTLIIDTATFLRCPHCDDTGDVHGLDGEWRGRCTCPAGQALGRDTLVDFAETVTDQELQPYQRDILEAMERQHRRNESAKLGANVATATSLGFRPAGKSWLPAWLKTNGFIK